MTSSMAHTRCMLDKQGYTPACTHLHAGVYAWKRARTHAHRQMCNSTFPRQQCFANAPQFYVTRKLAVLFKPTSGIICENYSFAKKIIRWQKTDSILFRKTCIFSYENSRNLCSVGQRLCIRTRGKVIWR